MSNCLPRTFLIALVAALSVFWFRHNAAQARSLDWSALKGLPTITVDGTICTLPDAIRAANDNSTVGGCTGSLGLDVILLETDVVLSVADSTNSSLLGGGYAGLPDVTSAIVLTAGSGSVIERNPALPCGPAEASAFRIFNVTATGELYLRDITLRGGCVAPMGAAFGGAIYLENGLLELVGSTLEGNETHGLADAMGARGGALYCDNAEILTIADSVFRDNLARGADGQVSLARAHGGVAYLLTCNLGSLNDSLFEDNAAVGSSDPDGDGFGGALFIDGSNIGEVNDTSWVGNLAQGGDDTLGGGASGRGGAVYLAESTTGFWRGITVRANRAQAGQSGGSSGQQAEGGGIFINTSSVDGIERGHFVDNVVQTGDAISGSSNNVRGGGLAINDDTTSVGWIRDSFFVGNRAQGGSSTGSGPAVGGGISITNSTVAILERVTFASNLAQAGQGMATLFGRGGAIRSTGIIDRIANCTFDDNRAVGGENLDPTNPGGFASGGALYLDLESSLELHGNTFVGNGAQSGAGGAADGQRSGGALYLDNIQPVDAVGNLFTGNQVLSSTLVAAAEDCGGQPDGLTSGGYNWVEAPNIFTFAATGDQTGLATSVYALADHGCQVTLPDGSCVPTVAIDQSSPAADAGSCTAALTAVDARGLPRPFDLPVLVDTDDGCDIGAFEAVDTDGDGFTEAADCAPADPSAHAVDHCGVCGGDDSSCSIFADGFESGDTSLW